MQSTRILAVALAWISGGFAANLVAAIDHPFHASRACVEFNPETSSLEVALCVFPDDFAAAVADGDAAPLNYADPQQVDQRARTYVAEKFQVWAADHPLQLHWVGHEQTAQQVWLYFEFPVAEGEVDGLAFRNSMLWELFDDQVNDVTLQIGPRCRTLTFRAGQTERQTLAAPNETHSR